MVSALQLPRVVALVAARLVLATLLWRGFSLFLREVVVKFGPRTGTALQAITLVQFHFLFYSSRTLPNTFASATSASRAHVCVLSCGAWPHSLRSSAGISV
jgi:alpha-1,6-mannosyltransferase